MIFPLIIFHLLLLTAQHNSPEWSDGDGHPPPSLSDESLSLNSNTPQIGRAHV